MSSQHSRSTRLEIASVDAAILSSEEFRDRYYLPQIPVIVTGVASHWPAMRLWCAEYLFTKLKGSAIQKAYNLDVGIDHEIASQCDTPACLAFLARRPEVTMPSLGSRDPHRAELPSAGAPRTQSLRIWISGKGTCTPWHYDGNSLQVANVQVRGRKRWSLISPETPLDCFRFEQIARAGYAAVEAVGMPVKYASCETGPGDMIFLPQHWYHSVVSTEEQNLNVNWVWTDRALLMQSTTATAVRERECIAALHVLGAWHTWIGGSPVWMKYLETYGGSEGFALTREVRASVSAVAIAKRCALELSRTVFDPYYRRLKEADELRRNEGLRRDAYDYFKKWNQRAARNASADAGPSAAPNRIAASSGAGPWT